MTGPDPRPQDEPDRLPPDFDPFNDGYVPSNEPALEGEDVPDVEEPHN